MKYRGSINKLSKLASSQQDAISNDDIPFVKSVEETLIQPESVQASIMALLTLLTTDYNPDSKVMSAVVADFNSERGPQSRQEGGKGVGYLRALGEVGRRVERGGWGNVFVGGGKGGEGVGGVGFQEGSSANKRGAREGTTVNVSKEDAILKTELDLLQTLHKSKYLLDLITECKTLTRKCKQYAQLSKNNDRDEGVALNWREVRMDNLEVATCKMGTTLTQTFPLCCSFRGCSFHRCSPRRCSSRRCSSRRSTCSFSSASGGARK
jgi:hypothetical protein